MCEFLTRHLNKTRANKPLAVTMGEPGGIGPELCLRLLAAADAAANTADADANNALPPLVIFGDKPLLRRRAKQFNIPLTAAAERAMRHFPLNADIAANITAGVASPSSAGYVLSLLDAAAAACLRGEFCAMLTAPLSKQAILAAGIPFTGQTEYLADVARQTENTAAAAKDAIHPVMLLAAPGLRVALATTHLPLRRVAQAISEESLLAALAVLHRDLPKYFNTAAPPHIKMCALNPHGGEGGHLGDEEQRILIPAIARAREKGIRVSGPYPADSLLASANSDAAADSSKAADCVLAMYHDQGLPVIKRHDFAGAVNITLGLPFLRVSPDHGTALDIAAAGGADPASMFAAARLAAQSTARAAAAPRPPQ